MLTLWAVEYGRDGVDALVLLERLDIGPLFTLCEERGIGGGLGGHRGGGTMWEWSEMGVLL